MWLCLYLLIIKKIHDNVKLNNHKEAVHEN